MTTGYTDEELELLGGECDAPSVEEEEVVTDEDLPYFALFDGVPADQVAEHASGLRAVLGS